MELFERMARDGHEQVAFCYDPSSGLRAVIAIHDTTLGPALGGTRMWDYEDEEQAVDDALRLAAGMTAKAAVAGVDYGGGKAVIWADPRTGKTEPLLRAFGRYLEGLRGRFITGNDVGTAPADFVVVGMETRWVGALPEAYGGCGDTSEFTAYGVFLGIRACLEHVYGDPTPAGRTVAVQGLGKVGAKLARLLHEAGCRLVVTDVDAERVAAVVAELPSAVAVAPEAIYDSECDVFAPCALGGVINDATLPRLRCRIVAGAANNPLAAREHALRLRERGILYAPDYVINAGGLIQVADDLSGYDPERVRRRVEGLRDLLLRIFRRADERGVTPLEAAEQIVAERIAARREQKRFTLRGERGDRDVRR